MGRAPFASRVPELSTADAAIRRATTLRTGKNLRPPESTATLLASGGGHLELQPPGGRDVEPDLAAVDAGARERLAVDAVDPNGLRCALGQRGCRDRGEASLGQRATHALQRATLIRREIHVDEVVACRLPGDRDVLTAEHDRIGAERD